MCKITSCCQIGTFTVLRVLGSFSVLYVFARGAVARLVNKNTFAMRKNIFVRKR